MKLNSYEQGLGQGRLRAVSRKEEEEEERLNLLNLLGRMLIELSLWNRMRTRVWPGARSGGLS